MLDDDIAADEAAEELIRELYAVSDKYFVRPGSVLRRLKRKLRIDAELAEIDRRRNG